MFYKLMRLFIVVVGCFIGPGLVLVCLLYTSRCV